MGVWGYGRVGAFHPRTSALFQLAPRPYTALVSLFTLLPPWTFLGLASAGILVGFGLRVLLRVTAWRRQGTTQTRQVWFEFLVGTLSQSAAIGLALTLIADFVLVAWTTDARLLAGLTMLIAAVTGFSAAFLRALISRLFYR